MDEKDRGPFSIYTFIFFGLNARNVQNPEVGNFAGFEVIVKRTKDGRNISKEYIEFLRQRYRLYFSIPVLSSVSKILCNQLLPIATDNPTVG